MEIYAVIMAGGVGARFWPSSREKRPKQLLSIFNEKSLIQNTFERLKGIIDDDKILIVTNKVQKPAILEQLPEIPAENVIEEPFGKNTAACIGLASVLVETKSENAITLVLPADHLIEDVEKFQKTLLEAAKFAETHSGLVTIGIQPDRPETGYGYIQVAEQINSVEIYKVKTFAEKPNIETAKRFLDSGDFFWNSGMFIWNTQTILNEIKIYMPELYEGLLKIQSAIGTSDFESILVKEYGQMKSISVDYGLMEKSRNVYVIKGTFDWNDVGSWEAVYQLSGKNEQGNVLRGDIYTESSMNSYIKTKKKFTAIVGVSNLIVIETDDALLICDRNNAQSIKLVVDHLKLNQRNDLL